MDKNGEERVGAERLGEETEEEDRLINLPDCLLWQVLLNLPTKEVVRCSLLSSRWRNLWRSVPGLDLDTEYCEFGDYDKFLSFVDGFLGFNSESCIQQFKLRFYWRKDDKPDITHFTKWINTVVDRKIQHLRLCVCERNYEDAQLQIPPKFYTCESLVSLELSKVSLLANPEYVSLPFVKVIDLDMVQFANALAFEMLISGCPVLESLNIRRNRFDNVQVLRVCSQSLLRLTYSSKSGYGIIEKCVVIDAPKLEYLELSVHTTKNFRDVALAIDALMQHDHLELDYHKTDSLVISNSPSLVKADINIGFHKFSMDDPQKRNTIRNFLVGISSAKDMVISPKTLEIIYDYSRYDEPLPLLPNLSFLDVGFGDYKWEELLIFLGSCPNLKSLVMATNLYPKDVTGIIPGALCFLSSLEFVKLVAPVLGGPMKMKLVSYFLENSPILKKLTLCLSDSFRTEEENLIFKNLHTITRLSASCQVVIL